MGKIIKFLIVVSLIVLGAKYAVEYFMPNITDITHLVNERKVVVEQSLGVTLSKDPDMVKEIFAYTEGQITVDGNSEIGVGIVYINGNQIGLHVNSKEYGIYGVKKGDTVVGVETNMTYEYEECFEVINDLMEGNSTSTYYYNRRNNDCLVVTSNDVSNRVVAITYFNNLSRVTEGLTSLY